MTSKAKAPKTAAPSARKQEKQQPAATASFAAPAARKQETQAPAAKKQE